MSFDISIAVDCFAVRIKVVFCNVWICMFVQTLKLVFLMVTCEAWSLQHGFSLNSSSFLFFH